MTTGTPMLVLDSADAAPAQAAQPAAAPAAAPTTAQVVDVNVPDIGSDEVNVTDVMVKVGDRVEVDQSIINVEGDKASMEVPAPVAGIVKEIIIKAGDKVSTGTLIMRFEVAGSASASAPAASAPAAAPAAPPAPAPQPQPEDSLLQDSLHVEADDLTFTSSIPIISPDNSPKMHQYMVRDEPVVEGEDTEIVETEDQTVSPQARPATAPQPTVKSSDSKAQQSRHTADAQSEADENRINVAPVPLNLPSPIRAMDAQGLDLSVLDEKSQQDSASAQAGSEAKEQNDTVAAKSSAQHAQTGALPAQKAAKNGSAKRKPSATGTVPKIPARTGSMPKVSDRTGSTPKVSEQKDAAPKVVNPWNTVRLQNPMGADSPSQASDRTGSTPKVSPRTGSVSRVSSSRTGSVPKVPTRTGSMSKVSDRTGSTPKVSERTGATPKVNARTGSLSQVKKSDSTPAKSPATGSTSAVKPSPQHKDAKPVAPSKNKPGFDKALNDGKNLTSDQATELAQRVSARTEKAMTSSIAKVNAAKSPRRLGNTASMKQVPATNTDETVSKYESIETSENKSLSLLSWIVIIGCIILAILGVYMFISNQR